jgi:hypothetical protein
MRRILTLMLAVAAVVTFTLAVHAPEAQAGKKDMMMMKAVTIEGTLVDTKCYSMMPKANAGNDHKAMKGDAMMDVPGCAAACANMGIPAGVVDGKGKLTTIIAPAASFASHMSKTVRITGTPAPDGAGIVADKAQYKDGASWKDISIVTMM